MTAEVLLEGRGLTKRYGGVVAVDDVDVDVRAGEVLGLVGPNGAGKTTLVDLITGAQPASGGSISLQGRPLAGSPARRARSGLARTFQHPLLALDLTVRDNLLVGLSAHRLRSFRGLVAQMVRGMLRSEQRRDHEAAEVLAATIRLDRTDRLTRDLTLGEQRLLEVGRALAQDPVVLLLDEPFAGSDSEGVEGIIDALRTVRDQGHGVVLVDHNVDLVASVVDRIVLLDQGRVRFDGDPSACLASPEMQDVYFGAQEVLDDA
ncbi:ATP-binding cassette domain-containing protein [Iamia majanohamensis]|uniref:ATP-binding cassette domain-containing protein n=1 Tax=Iamia majanohamensis TaxID=467976 RepID=A0AAE9YHE5_9ACTN|nr:ATP-binding cassette domain-containing protein [Iamia majanohamensis]WCO67826.1 ATP-binding cassette domain-containing protein [Iamia majanohamensis]